MRTDCLSVVLRGEVRLATAAGTVLTVLSQHAVSSCGYRLLAACCVYKAT